MRARVAFIFRWNGSPSLASTLMHGWKSPDSIPRSGSWSLDFYAGRTSFISGRMTVSMHYPRAVAPGSWRRV
jgi:hypothetical protein